MQTLSRSHKSVQHVHTASKQASPPNVAYTHSGAHTQCIASMNHIIQYANNMHVYVYYRTGTLLSNPIRSMGKLQ